MAVLCIVIEIKGATRWDRRDLAGLNAFLAATKKCTAGILACNALSPVRLEDKLWAVEIAFLFS